VHFLLLPSVAVADVALDMVAGVVRFVVWGGVFVALAWDVQLVILAGVTVVDVEQDAVAGVVRLVMWDGVHVGACVGCADGDFCRPGDGGGGAACHA